MSPTAPVVPFSNLLATVFFKKLNSLKKSRVGYNWCVLCRRIKLLPLYVIHAASRTAIVTQIIVLRENWIKQYMFFHHFFCVKTPKEAARSWRRRRIVQVHLNKLECREKVHFFL